MSQILEKPKMLVIGLVPPALRESMGAFFQLEDYPLEGPDAQPVSMLPSGFDALLTRAICGVPPGVTDALPELRLILSLGAGTERIHVADLHERGISFVNTPDSMTEDVADYAIGLMYALRRHIVAADNFVRSGQWGVSAFPVARRMATASLGIVGLGRIGCRIADKAAALGLTVHYHGRTPRPEITHIYHDSIADLAEVADILVLACPGTDETRHIIDAPVLRALGPNGLLINIARGSVVDEAALLTALENGTILGAALDVFESEPGIDPRFLELRNILLSPHAAAITEEARMDAVDRLVSAGRSFTQGSTTGEMMGEDRKRMKM